MRVVIALFLVLFFAVAFVQSQEELSAAELIGYLALASMMDETESDQTFAYDKATGCTGGPTKGAKNLLAFLQSKFPGGTSGGIYNCRNVRGGSSFSLHSEGRAVDYMLSIHKSAQKAIGDNIVNFFISNGAANALKFGVQEVIWNRKIWTHGKGQRAYTGQNPHEDHVHIGMNKWGASNCCKA